MDWKVFSATFVTLFLAEMGDKTQLAAISMTSKTGQALSVFLGAALALVLVTAIGVLVGEGLMKIIPEMYIKRGAALLFVVIGVLMFFEVI